MQKTQNNHLARFLGQSDSLFYFTNSLGHWRSLNDHEKLKKLKEERKWPWEEKLNVYLDTQGDYKRVTSFTSNKDPISKYSP